MKIVNWLAQDQRGSPYWSLEETRNYAVRFPREILSEGPTHLVSSSNLRKTITTLDKKEEVFNDISLSTESSNLSRLSEKYVDLIKTKGALHPTEHKIQPQTSPERPRTKCGLEGKQCHVSNLKFFFYQISDCWFKVDKLEIRTYTEFSINYSVTVYWRIFLNRELNAFLENMWLLRATLELEQNKFSLFKL